MRVDDPTLEEAERRSGFEQPDHRPDAPPPYAISATPFRWSDPKTFPRRQWLYGYHLVRKYVSCTIAPSGVGKTSLLLVEAVAMATGRSLLGIQARHGKLKVWVINLEDPREEIERRILAILLHYKIDPAELDGQLFVDSGRDLNGFVIATQTRDGAQIAQPVVDALTAEIVARTVDVLIVDPLVKAHRITENDNGAVDLVCTSFAGIADVASCAVDLVHHVRKTGGNEVTIEDARGAGALISASRSARVLNVMTKDQAAGLGNGIVAREHFRTDNGKSSMAPPVERSDWYKLLSVCLENGGTVFDEGGDKVQVVEPWTWPDAMSSVTVDHLRKVQTLVRAGNYREHISAKDWVGKAVAEAMGLDATDKAAQTIIKTALKRWIENKMFKVVEREDEHRERKKFIEVDQPASDG